MKANKATQELIMSSMTAQFGDTVTASDRQRKGRRAWRNHILFNKLTGKQFRRKSKKARREQLKTGE